MSLLGHSTASNTPLHNNSIQNHRDDYKGWKKEVGGLMKPLLEMASKVATEKTEVTTYIKNIRSLMETLNLTAKQAMDALKIPADEQKEYMALI